MASLNANTTGARSSGVQLGEVDFMNSYGDQVAWDLMADDPELHEKLDFPLGGTVPSKEKLEGAMAKVTGRSLLLPLDEQRQLFDTLKQNFTEYIAQREAIGESPMESKTLDLQAKTSGRIELAPARSDSLFAGATFVEVVQARSLRKPFTEEAVANQVRKAVGMEIGGELAVDEFEPSGEPRRRGEAAMEARIASVQERVDEQLSFLDSKIALKQQRYETESPEITQRIQELQAQLKEKEDAQKTAEGAEAKPELSKEQKSEIETLQKSLKAEQKSLGRLQSNTSTQEEEGKKSKLSLQAKGIKDRLELCPVGQPVRIYDKELGSVTGIVTDVQRVQGIKNPLVGGAWKVKFAIADGARELTLKLSDINVDKKVWVDKAEHTTQYKPPFDRVPIHKMFGELQQERFETRQIVIPT